MDEKPLNVRVAEALGWTEIQYAHSVGAYGRRPDRSGGLDGHGIEAVPCYDTDWSASGPLIDKYKLELWTNHQYGNWSASVGIESPGWDSAMIAATGETALKAACVCILEMSKAGKLDQSRQ